MNKFKSLIMGCQGKSKTFLHWLYNTHSEYDEDEKVFEYKDLIFWFRGTGFRNTEKLILNVGIPKKYFSLETEYNAWNIKECMSDMNIPTENYILHLIAPIISKLQDKK